jgi:outer membrane protein assembly factor BamB
VAYAGSQDGTVAALRTTDGSLLWHYKTNGVLIGMPTLFNGVIYAVSDKQTLFALDASDGALLYKMGGSFLRSPIVVNDVAYVSLDDSTEYAFQPSTGALLWRYTHDGAALVPPLVSNGIVYVIATKFAAYAALAPAAGDARQTSGNRLLLQRSVPVISASSSVYALRASDGTLLWHYTGNATQGYSWAAVADGVVYVSTLVNMYKGYVIALQGNNGSLVWSEATDDPPTNASAIFNGVVYVGAENGDLYALQAGNGSLLWHYTIFGAILNTPVLSGEMAYVGSANGIVYALRAGSGTLLWYYLTKVSGS